MHKLFGMANVIKLIRTLKDPSKKDIAMRTIVVESDCELKTRFIIPSLIVEPKMHICKCKRKR
ncbi:hypothetical protein Goklo_007102 [Gossypium klotzschianum]|uniref:LOB domain-containing protein n=1 Tax=Gossypium klotzschianum TaxID=34286 RepID=A0A7J8VKT2_9ROSI|nr:hypothetical protein [Gossypium klotzschianum]